MTRKGRLTNAPPNGLDLLVSAYSGLSCRLLISSNFVTWSVVASNQIGPDGTLLFHRTDNAVESSLFYRVVMP